MPNADEDAKQLELLFTPGRKVKWYRTPENGLTFLKTQVKYTCTI